MADLAPDTVVSIDSLTPEASDPAEDEAEDSTLSDFKDWLDSLR